MIFKPYLDEFNGFRKKEIACEITMISIFIIIIFYNLDLFWTSETYGYIMIGQFALIILYTVFFMAIKSISVLKKIWTERKKK